jgi:hypothetical protein
LVSDQVSRASDIEYGGLWTTRASTGRPAHHDTVPPIASCPPELRLLPFRGSQAVRAGLLTWAQLRRSAWRRLLPDVYVAADVELDHRLRCRAALVYAGASRSGDGISAPRSGVAISGMSAAACWGLDLLPPAAPVELIVPPVVRLDSRPGQLRLIRSRLRPEEITTLGTITLTTPERTAFDVVRWSDRVDGIVALDALLHRRVVRMASLSSYRAAIGRGPGSRQFSDALTVAEPLAESPMETRSRLVLVDAGLPRPVAQFVVRDSAGRFVARVDLAYPVERVALEYEGDHHRERDTFLRDIDRLNALTALDWVVVRATARDIYRDSDQLVRRVGELLRRRRI